MTTAAPAETQAAQAACMGCCINPGWINPNPFTNDPFQYQYGPKNPNPFQPTTFHTGGFPTFIDNLTPVKLTEQESDLLKKLVEAYNQFTALDKRSEADNKEFVDAIHRCQQIVALRVARRVNPEVWTQPE